MPDNKDEVVVVVNGQPVRVEANPHAPLQTIVPRALKEAGIVGQPPENWELRDANGNLLDLARKIDTFGFAAGTELFLSLRAGIGG